MVGTNNFSNKTRLLFLYVNQCFNCGKVTDNLELHHIEGRQGVTKSSPFNASPLCNYCHSFHKRKSDYRIKLIELTVDYLLGNNYQPTELDREFAKKFCPHIDLPPEKRYNTKKCVVCGKKPVVGRMVNYCSEECAVKAVPKYQKRYERKRNQEKS
jgi:predicted nucleic acid-binding Zn ribbon protein